MKQTYLSSYKKKFDPRTTKEHLLHAEVESIFNKAKQLLEEWEEIKSLSYSNRHKTLFDKMSSFSLKHNN